MAIAYHTHTFEIPTATDAETQAGAITDKVVVPAGLAAALASYVTSTALTTTLADYALSASLGTAAAQDVGYFATAAQGALADSALQPAAIGVSVQAYSAYLSTIAGLAKTDGNFIVGNGTDWTAESGATARASLGLTIGTNVQAYSANLDEYAGVNPTPAGLALLDDADAAAQRTTLGLGTAAVKNTGTSGDAVPILNAANTWDEIQTFSTTASGTAPVRVESSDASASQGPFVDIVRTSASPAASDALGGVRFRGMNSAATEKLYTQFRSRIIDPTDGSEDGALEFVVNVGGVNTQGASLANGFVVGAPTGSYQGTGTINATGYYLNGVALGTAALKNTGTSGDAVPLLNVVNAFSAAQTFSATADAFIAPPLNVTKHSSPLNYSSPAQNAPAAVLQWSDGTALGSAASRDSFLFNTTVTADGVVTPNLSLPSGGTSFSIWRGANSAVNKSGDGSAHSFTGQCYIGAMGTSGYTEGAVLVGTTRNDANRNAALHGAELVTSDGLGTSITTGTAQAGAALTITLAAGASAVDDAYVNYGIHITGGTGTGQWKMISDYVGATKVATVTAAWSVQPDNTSVYEILDARDTQLIGYIARVQRDYGGLKEAINYLATNEGTQAATAILLARSDDWARGIDFEDATFATTHALRLAEGHLIRWYDGANASTLGVNSSGQGAWTVAGTQTSFTVGGSTEALRLSSSTSANPVYMRVNSVLAQVTVGAVDSGGAGFRLLRVAN